MQDENDGRERAEERLRLLSMAVEQCSEGIAVSDLAGTLLFVNRAFAAMHGYEPEELVGEPLSVFHTPEQMLVVDAANKQIRETGGFSGEVWHAHRAGTVFPTLMRNSLVRNEAGEPVGMIAAVRDITELRQAEEKLRDAERERAIVLDTLSEVVTYLDRDLRVVWANRAAAELSGTPVEEMVGRRCHKIWFQSAERCPNCIVERAMETGQPEQAEVTIPDGRVFSLRAYPVRDEAGAVVGTVEVALDVTERERAKQQRRESEREKELILSTISELVSFQDTQMRILWANRAGAEAVGLRPDDLIGRHCYEIWCRRDAPGDDCPVRRAMASGEPEQGEVTTPDGRVWDIRGYPVRGDDGQILGAVEVTLEITKRRRAEEEARRQSALRTTLIETSPAFFVAIDTEGRTMMMNESMLLALGYTLEEVVGTDYLATFVPERERERMGRLFHRLTDLKAPALNENHVLTKDGRELLVEWHGRPVVNEDDEFQYFFGVGINITERRRAEHEIREREARYRAIVEAFDGFVYICSPDYRIEFMNQALADRTGRDATGELCYRALQGLDAVCPWCVNDRVFQGETVRWEVHSPKDGRWYYVVNTPLTHADGSMSKQSMVIDITERKEAEEALRRSEGRFQQVTENAQVWVWEVDAEGVYTYASPTLERVLGYTPAEIVGKKHFYDLFHPEERGELERAALEVFARREPFSQFLNRNVHKDGRTVWLQTSGVPMLDAQGRFIGYRGADVDITERVRAETALREHRERLEELVAERTAELRAVNAELEAFAYTVSHDLRAPLRAVEGFSTALIEDYGERLDAEGRDYALSITHAARRMDTLIRDLLAYSRVGRTAMALVPVELGHVVQESFMQLAAIVQDSGAAIEVKDELPVVLAHKSILVQAVTNLLSNAIKFVAPGERPRVRVWAERRGETVRLWVEDEGIGIEAESQEQIFTVFERLHPADDYPGTGIGLAVVRRGIERMGGQVGVESEPGRGSRFWIELPAAEAGPLED